jgi:type I restriction enzyme S subunit
VKDAPVNKTALKRLFKVVNGSTPKSDINSYWDGDVTWVTPEDLGKMQGDTIAASRRRITNEGLANCGASLVPAASIILSTRAPIGNVAIAEVPLCTNQGCKALVPRSSHIVSRYFFYQIQSLKTELNVLGNGTTFLELSGDKLGQVRLFTPSPQTQSAIADFLDRETAEADAFVAKYERLIELLEEKRVALITQAVTKGLDPSVSMKDSGVAWLGEIPRHWSATTFNRHAKRIVVGIAEAATHAYVSTGVPILRSTNVRANLIQGEILNIDPAFAKERGSKSIEAYDLVTVRTGNAGVTAVVPTNLAGCQCFTMLITSLDDKSEPAFYSYALNSSYGRHFFAREAWGTAQANISVPILKEFQVAAPPREEQRQIVNYLSRRLSQIDDLVKKTDLALDLVRERRSALITAAVTGQIDVKNYPSKKLSDEERL